MTPDYKITFNHYDHVTVAHPDDDFLIRDYPYFFVANDDDITMYSGVCTELTEDLAELMLNQMASDVGVTNIAFFDRTLGTYVDTAY
jgi:hypothetical protein